MDYFFDKYGDIRFGVLLDDAGITHEQQMEETGCFAPYILNTFKESGQLEALIRRRLESFYTSSAAVECLKTG